MKNPVTSNISTDLKDSVMIFTAVVCAKKNKFSKVFLSEHSS